MKKKNILLIFMSAIVVMFSFMFCIKMVDADSGWDFDYDSGSSWDSGSDWGSSDWGSSSWDSDYGSGSYSGGGSAAGFATFMIIFIVFVVIIILSSKGNNRVSSYRSAPYSGPSKHNYFDLSKDKIAEIDPSINVNELKNIVFDIYNKVQNAWTNIDYEELRKYVSDELYNMYKSQLKVLEAKKQKNIMENITYIDSKLVDLTIENGVEKVKMYLNIKMKDYVIDSNKRVVRGNKSFTNDVEYFITLTRNISDSKLEACPSCGAPIDIKAGGKCSYCGSTIVHNNTEFVMSKKENIGQRRG